MSLEQQLTETSQAVLMLTKSVDLLTAVLGDVIGRNDDLIAALKAQGIKVEAKPATVTQDKPKTEVKAEAKKEEPKQEAKTSPFEKEDFTKRMGEIVALVGTKGDGRGIAQAVLAMTGSDKVGMTIAMDAEVQAQAINNLDAAITLLKGTDQTIGVNKDVFNVMMEADSNVLAKEEQTDDTGSDFDDDVPEETKGSTTDLPDYYDDDTKVDLTQVQLAMRAHAGKFGKDSAIAILKAAGSPSGAAKDLPEVRRKCVIDKLMQGC